MSCLFLCPLIVNRYKEFIERYFGNEINVLSEDNKDNMGLYNNIPEEVFHILSNDNKKLYYDYGEKYNINALIYSDMREEIFIKK